MVKESKYLRKQAAKAERTAARFTDAEISDEMRALAKAYRSQAEVVKKQEKSTRTLAKQARSATSKGPTDKGPANKGSTKKGSTKKASNKASAKKAPASKRRTSKIPTRKASTKKRRA